MSAQDLTLQDQATCVAIEACFSALFDSQARRRIVMAWQNGWLLGDHAMELLIGLDLIEVPDEC